MTVWLVLLTANAWGLLLLIQGSLANSRERLEWLQKRAVMCAWMSFVGAAVVIGLGAYAIYGVYAHGPSPGYDIKPEAFVSYAMKSILVALLLMPVPLLARVVVNRRLQKPK